MFSKPINLVLIGIIIYLIKKMCIDKAFEYVNDSKKKQRYYDWIAPKAKALSLVHGIPWQFICVQTALETGWGKSSLASKYFNFGGQKAVSGEPFVELKTREVINGQSIYIMSKFRKFSNLKDGLKAYANFFHKYKRYATALKYPNDPYQFAVEIKKAGYATDPNYVTTLHKMLNDLKNYT